MQKTGSHETQIAALLIYALVVFSFVMRHIVGEGYMGNPWVLAVMVVVLGLAGLYAWKTKRDWLQMTKRILHGNSGSQVLRIPRWLIVMTPLAILVIGVVVYSFSDYSEDLGDQYQARQGIITVIALFLMLSTKREYADNIARTAMTAGAMLATLLVARKVDAVGVGIGILVMTVISDVIYRDKKSIRSFVQDIAPGVVALTIYELLIPSSGFAFMNALRFEWNVRWDDVSFIYDAFTDGGWPGKALVLLWSGIWIAFFVMTCHGRQPPIDRDKSFFFLVYCGFLILLSELACCICGPDLLYVPDISTSILTDLLAVFCINALSHVQVTVLPKSADMSYEEIDLDAVTVIAKDQNGDDAVFWFVDLVNMNDMEYVLMYPMDGTMLERPQIFELQDAEEPDMESYVFVEDPDVTDQVYKKYRKGLRFLRTPKTL